MSIETLRSTAFGKILRFVTNKHILKYAVEEDPEFYKVYLGDHVREKLPDYTLEGEALAGVISQASHHSRNASHASDGRSDSDVKEGLPTPRDKMIGWIDGRDSEVRFTKLKSKVYSCSCMTCRILRTGPVQKIS